MIEASEPSPTSPKAFSRASAISASNLSSTCQDGTSMFCLELVSDTSKTYRSLGCVLE
ncbi:MAG: hypothetical protein IKM23_00900 [Bacteroidales bacterium]|nr:hypothetical protein [Clostridia bacterium]MBR6774260.1 hypothetical protein [Bacteroidales bacterium]